MKRMAAFLLMMACMTAGALAEKRVTLTFAGDVTLGSEERLWKEESSLVRCQAREGDAYFLERVRPLFAQDDVTVVNLEGVLSDSSEGENRDKTYRFRGPSAFARILTAGSVEMVSLANNHTMDYGARGYADTQAALDGEGVAHFGGREVCFFEKDGVRLAFVGCSYTTLTREERAWTMAEIARLKREEGVGAVICTYHGGQEYGDARTRKQQDFAKDAIAAGADLVIMHHAHVVQGMSVFDNRSVCYSLGNFCFGGNCRVRAMESLVVVAELTFSDDGVYLGQQLTLYPAHVSGTEPDNNFQPLLVTDEADVRRVMRRVQQDTRFTLEPFDPEMGAVRQVYLPAGE